MRVPIPGTAISIGAMGVYPYSPEIEALCTFIPSYSDPVQMSKRRGNCLLVPRRLVQTAEQDYRTQNFLGAIDCKVPPRNEDQAQVIEKSFALLSHGTDHIVEAPTGFGKTYVGTAIGCRLGQTTLVTVTKQDLIDQWHKTFKMCGVPESQVGHVQANKCDFKGKRFVVAMVHSLAIPDRYDPELYTYFGLMVCDETHRMAADSFAEVCAVIPARYRLGLSATPKRLDGKTPVLEAHIGPVLVRGTAVPMKPKVLIKKTGWEIPKKPRRQLDGEWRMEKIPYSPGRMAAVFNAMAEDQFRNRKIADFVKQAYDADRTILVLSDTLAHLKNLFQFIADQGVPGEQIGYYVGGMNKPALEANSKRRVVLATYGMVGEGTDCPWWDTGVPATPRSNIKQAIGRIMRFAPDKKEPVWLDLVDEDGIFSGFANKRLQQYYEVGAKIVKVET